ncbi:Cupin, RmlC-type [Niveomyces insectorum RCEF 264]|uniref:Cupin, RmlC-type n=1 Tax=Niveomyces insectorum RCEF 264 TaxID=1081102 RepID=A0A167R8R3_9HYPO|nr:Cupin, RmlC-type [Niveomyces insectorum RCEF 264]
MPILLPANQPPNSFYRGGPQIRQFRFTEPASSDPRPDYQSEDWIASTTPCRGSRPLGLTKLPDGRWLADAVVAKPMHWLGPAHVAAFGVDTKLLVKLLDAGQRLPIHIHPEESWVKEHISGATHGKAEAWYVLTGGTVYLGLQQDVDADTLQQLVLQQDTSALLKKMHRFDVRPHQTIYVPPATLHAIGEGVLVVEVQEPADMSVLLEWTDFQIDGAEEGHLGVGWDAALTAVDRKGRSRAEMECLVVDNNITPASADATRIGVFAKTSEAFFRMERVQLQSDKNTQTLPRGFAVVIVLEGSLELATEKSGALSLVKGNTALVAYGDGNFTLKGAGQTLVARPPKVGGS